MDWEGKWVKETYLEASISTRLAGNPSRHLTQCATWPALLRAGNRVLSDTPNVPIDVDPGDGSDIERIQDNIMGLPFVQQQMCVVLRGFQPETETVVKRKEQCSARPDPKLARQIKIIVSVQ